MRLAIAMLFIASALWPIEAQAVEKFIPLGQAYSPEDPTLPELNSAQDQINAQVDIYESEIYVREKAAKIFQSDLNQFQNNRNSFNEPGGFIDY